MILFSKLQQWTSEDASNLRELFENKTLRSALLHTYSMRPDLLTKGSTEDRLTNAGVVAGYEAFVENLVSLTTEEPALKQSAGVYPALEDESAWPEDLLPPVPPLPQPPVEVETN